jgi:hypothetical protein
MIHKSYFKRQVRTLVKFAQSTSDPKLVAALVKKAVDLKSQVDDAATAARLECTSAGRGRTNLTTARKEAKGRLNQNHPV